MKELRHGRITGVIINLICIILISLYTLMIIAAWGPVVLKGNGFPQNGEDPIGMDFSIFYVGSALIIANNGCEVFDKKTFQQEYLRTLGKHQNYFWAYPPTFLLIVAPLSLITYHSALLIWISSTLLIYIVVMYRIIPSYQGILLCLAFPATFLNFINGHTGFLSAALFGAGLLIMEKSPWGAGFLFGCLSYKPHLALLVPVALAAGGYWRTFGGAAISLLGLILVSTLVFGAEIWPIFLNSFSQSVDTLVSSRRLGQLMLSSFSAARIIGLGNHWAWLIQTLVMGVALLGVAWSWSRGGRPSLRYAALILACLLFTPYAFFYDLTLLALPLAWLGTEGLETGWLPGEKVLLIIGWWSPLAIYSFQKVFPGLPVAPLTLASLFLLTLSRQRLTLQGGGQEGGWQHHPGGPE